MARTWTETGTASAARRERGRRSLEWRAGTHDRVVVAGVLDDPYNGRGTSFVKELASGVQIDHVVALSDAWQKGAQGGTARRTAFANDPLNLLAVDGPTNQSKGDGDAATWLPPNKAYRCRQVARQVSVKTTHGLWVTSAEHAAAASILAGCPEEPLPLEESAAAALLELPGRTTPPTAVAIPAEGDGATYYASCAAARAVGAAPILHDRPGYRSSLDGDDDGVACEQTPLAANALSVSSGVRGHLNGPQVGLIVLGATRRTGLEDVRVGATAADIVRTSTVPSLVVPASAAAGPDPTRQRVSAPADDLVESTTG